MLERSEGAARVDAGTSRPLVVRKRDQGLHMSVQNTPLSDVRGLALELSKSLKLVEC
jgi:hypothetical protein